MLEAIILGILQGLTEFIPVSSSAHLILLPWFFGWEGMVNTLSFSVALHFGTLIALLVYFRRDWITILVTARKKDGLFWHILLATIPAAAAGFFFNEEIGNIRSPLLITFTLILVAIFMIITEKRRRATAGLGIESMTRRDALIIGIAQACALVPGVSRSGITIVAGLTRGFQRQASARFSFLLSTPVIAGASILEGKKLLMSPVDIHSELFLTGIIVSALTGYAAIKYLLRYLRNHSLNPFAYYRFFLAFVIIITLWAQR
jgi:undecaprenyl-diphosphatase